MGTSNQHELGLRGEAFFLHWAEINAMPVVKFYKTMEEQHLYGDARLLIDGKEKNVEFKVEDVETPYLFVETIQDYDTEKGGWLESLTQCDELWYARVSISDDAPFGILLTSIYRVSLPRLRRDFSSYGGDKWTLVRSRGGHGEGEGHLAPLSELVKNETAIHWWGDEL